MQMFRGKFCVSLVPLALRVSIQPRAFHGKEPHRYESSGDRHGQRKLSYRNQCNRNVPANGSHSNLATERKAAGHGNLPSWIAYVESYHWSLCVFGAFALCILSEWWRSKTNFPTTTYIKKSPAHLRYNWLLQSGTSKFSSLYALDDPMNLAVLSAFKYFGDEDKLRCSVSGSQEEFQR